jgi:hypothetical protein
MGPIDILWPLTALILAGLRATVDNLLQCHGNLLKVTSKQIRTVLNWTMILINYSLKMLHGNYSFNHASWYNTIKICMRHKTHRRNHRLQALDYVKSFWVAFILFRARGGDFTSQVIQLLRDQYWHFMACCLQQAITLGRCVLPVQWLPWSLSILNVVLEGGARKPSIILPSLLVNGQGLKHSLVFVPSF